ncbi:hypothetical protein KKF61_08575 [Patescibacteria group bacterium]|nr:hypothetical protein [Patescibacteria group bacterium]MBU0964713.1 hypothetical protein [Patescibacteria group bacterium]
MRNFSDKIKKQFFIKRLALALIGFSLVFILAASSRTVLAEWKEPDMFPVEEQFEEPLTTGAEDQTKQGYLEINPEYNPTEATALHFDPQRPLHVYGEGVKFSTENVYSDILTVDTDTLYVNSFYNWVGVGTTLQTDGYIMKVVDGTVKAGDSTSPLTGRAVSSYSSDNIGIYGYAGSTGTAGVYGLHTEANGLAVKGSSEQNVGVKGESSGGIGIYAITDSISNAAVVGANNGSGWAGYFDGWLGTGADVIGAQFLPSSLQMSLMPFKSGVKVGTYQMTEGPVVNVVGDLAFDGTYMWVSSKSGDQASGTIKLYKVRATDGELVQSFDMPTKWPDRIIFDGDYLWLGEYNQHSIFKISREDGSELAQCLTSPDPADPLDTLNYWGTSESPTITTSVENGEVFVWTANNRSGDLTKFDRNCVQQGVFPVGSAGEDEYLNRLNDQGWRVRANDVVFADGHIWTLTPNVCEEAGVPTPFTQPFFTDVRIKMCATDANCGEAGYSGTCLVQDTQLVKMNLDGTVETRYDIGLSFPTRMIYDGVHLWIINGTDPATESYVAKVRASDGQLVALFDLPGIVTDLTFDGTYIWFSGNGYPTGSLYRIAASNSDANNPNFKIFQNVLMSGYWSGELIFDGTYLWHMTMCGFDAAGNPACGTGNCAEDPVGSGHTNCPLTATKHFTGTGWGHPDVGSVANLRTREGVCSITVAQTCVFDWHCPDGETCSAGHQIQSGNFNVTESSEIGSDLLVGGDVIAKSNVWSGSENTIGVAGTADCPAGQYVKGVTVDSNGYITDIICQGI